MTPERIEIAIEVIGQLADLAGNAPEESKEAVSLTGNLTIAHGAMVEFLIHLNRGNDPAEAMRRTIRGELPLGDPRDKAA
jgi:hypothetical protein